MNNTKERPIALTAQEVNAVLAGDKTRHRVPIKMRYGSPDFLGSRDCNKSDPSLWGWDNFEDSETRVLPNEPCPFGVVGDRLWVQEFHARREFNDPLIGTHYYADGPLTLDLRHDAGLLIKYAAENMPRWASRLLLEITDIRIERLNDISEQDAIAQGIKHIHADPKDRVGPNHFTKSNGWYHCSRPTAAEVFKEMYKVSDDYEKYGENPWVWVIEFKTIESSEVTSG
ncbi:MAG: hypothetical protein ACTH7L_01620 [Psychrobacter alimentarius]